MIADKELYDFCRWYNQYFGDKQQMDSVFVTCMCGHFHSHPKAMKELLERMQTLGLVIRHKGTITIKSDEPDFRPFGEEW